MDEFEYLNSEELRLLTGRAGSFLQVQMLNESKIPHCLDKYGTPLVRFREVREFSQIVEAQSKTNRILDQFRAK